MVFWYIHRKTYSNSDNSKLHLHYWFSDKQEIKHLAFHSNHWETWLTLWSLKTFQSCFCTYIFWNRIFPEDFSYFNKFLFELLKKYIVLKASGKWRFTGSFCVYYLLCKEEKQAVRKCLQYFASSAQFFMLSSMSE